MTTDVISASSPWRALALMVATAVGPGGAAFAQPAGGDEAMGQRARQAFGADTGLSVREPPPVPGEERLLELIERTRRAFQGDVPDDAGEDARPSGERLVERVRRLREEVRSGLAAAEDAVPSEAEVADLRERLGERFGVEVLEARAIEADGRPAWAVEVMNPGGNSNAAFMVTTLVVDQESGEVLGELPSSIATGTGLPERGVRRQPATDESGLAIRRRTHR